MSLLFVAAVVLLCSYICVRWFNGMENSSLPLPPGPSHWQSLKLFMNLLRNKDAKLHIMADDLYRQYGDIVTLKLPGSNMIFLNSTQIIRKLFASPKCRDVTSDRPHSFFKKYLLNKDFVLRDYDDLQIRLRKIIHNTMKLYGNGIQSFEEMVGSEIRLLEKSMTADDGGSTVKSFDIDAALTTSLIRIVYIFLTNETPRDVERVVEVVNRFDKVLIKIFRIEINLAFTLFPWLRFIPGPTKSLYDYYKSCADAINSVFLNPEMIKKLEEHKSGLLGVLIADPDTPNDTIPGILVNILSAGFVTTKGALSAFFLLILNYPDVQKRIQDEIDNKIGHRKPSIEDRSKMHYTCAAILETLRFIRHIPFAAPHCNRVDIDVDGYGIPAKSTILANLWSIGFSEQYWENPSKFSPERFLDENGEILPVDHSRRQQFIPFGVGKRSCVGEAFSKSRVFLYITSLLQKFTFTKGEEPLPSIYSDTWGNDVALIPGPFKCTVIKRR